MEKMMQYSTASTLMSTYASLTGSIMLIQTMANQIIPTPLKNYVKSLLTRILGIGFNGNKFMSLVLEQTVGFFKNELYEAAEVYLTTIVGNNVDQIQVAKIGKNKNLNITVDKNQEVCDTFRGIKVIWKVGSVSVDHSGNNNMGFQGGLGGVVKEETFFVLKFEKVYKEVILNEYLRYVVEEAKKETERNKTVRLYTLNMGQYLDRMGGGYHGWGSLTLDHPATFDTMAMNSELKKAIIEDLDRFVSRREFYRRVGKAWKRGYLLYGPPGTGKSSLIAAIANYLKFDVYDVELSSLRSDAELRGLLVSTSNRSIIVIEDIDCSEKMQRRVDASQGMCKTKSKGNQVSLSGMLNFADGLWSSCGDERIIIFTTNHVDRIDPALLRPGRMDMHIHMSYCTSESFKILASRYLGDEMGDGSSLCFEIEDLIDTVQVTPAEVAEELLRNADPGVALQGVLNRLKRKASEIDFADDDGTNFNGAKELEENGIRENLKDNGVQDNIGNGGSNFTVAKKLKTSPA